MEGASVLELLFQQGNHQFTIPCHKVEKVIPLVYLRDIQGAPKYIAGLLNYRGKFFPVIDFKELHEDSSSEKSFHSRIILLKNPKNEGFSLIGLLVELVVRTTQLEEAVQRIRLTGLPYFGGLTHSEEGVVYEMDVDALFKLIDPHVVKLQDPL